MMIRQLVLAIFVVGLMSSLIIGQEWTGFQNGGRSSAKLDLPESWSTEAGIAWQVPLTGYGQSTPVIYANQIYVTSVVGENKESVRVEAFSVDDGKSLWSYEQKNSSPEKNTVMVSRAAPSPVADKDGVVAFFEGGDLVALDHTGKERWSRNLKEDFGALKARHGIAASLEQDQQHVFVWVERMESPYVMALSKNDGKEVWKQDGVGGTSWGSPRLLDVGGKKHLVLSASGQVVGLDPVSGKRLWEMDDISGNSSTTPVPVGDGRFLIGASGGRPGQENVPSCGVIKVEEIDKAFVASWAWRAERATCSFGSPVAYDGKGYFVNRSGIVHCHDLKSGEELYKGRLPCNQIWATPLATANGIYFFGKDGMTSLLKSGNELEVAGTNKLWDIEKKSEEDKGGGQAARFSGAVLYAAAVADSKLILRRGDRLYAVGK